MGKCSNCWWWDKSNGECDEIDAIEDPIGDDIRGAVKLFKESLTDEYSISCVDIENLNVWGCRFFDNETDAKKSFG